MIATRDIVGLVVHLEVTATERADLEKLFYNLKDGVAPHANMDDAQISRVNNLFSPLYDVFEVGLE